MESNGDFQVAAGPDMTQEKFGHCAFLHPNRNKVVLAGGFDGTNQYMKFSEEFILNENSWSTRPWSDMKIGILYWQCSPYCHFHIFTYYREHMKIFMKFWSNLNARKNGSHLLHS